MSAETTRALAHNTLLQMGGKAVAMVLGVATVSVMLHYFGDEGYGEFITAVTFLSLFAVVVDFGLTLITIQMISEPGADESKILGNLLSLRLITGLVVFSAAPLVGLLFPYSAEIKLAIAVGSVAYLFQTMGQMLVGVYQKRLKMTGVVIAELVARASLLAGILLVVYFAADLFDAMIALVVSNVAQALLLLILANHFIRFRARIDLKIWKEIIHRAWPIGVSIFFNLIYLRGDIILLSLMRTQAEVGQYGGAYKVIDVVTTLPVMFMGLALPILVKAWKGRDRTTFEETMQKAFNFFSMIAVPLAVGSFALATPLMVLVGGEQFGSAGPILAILSPAAAVVFYGALFGHAVVAVEKQRTMVIGYALTAAVSVGAYVLLIPIFGTLGAAWVTLISETIVALLTAIVVYRASRFRLRLTVLSKVVAASMVMYLFLMASGSFHVIPQVVLGSLVYLVVLVALGGVTPKSLRALFV
ncbi:MAG: flippase [Patescibacteria group bacterium]